MYSAILLAGGAGTRMRQNVPKQFLPLGGRPMLLHTLERFEKIDEIAEVVIVCLSQYKELLQTQINSYVLKKKCIIVDGGATRQESTYLGLLAASQPKVIIHEAARPFVTVPEFLSLIREPQDAATYGIDIPFTVSIRTDDEVTGLLDRKTLVNIQLPQKFGRDALLAAHEQAKKEGLIFTEDASLFFHYTKNPVKILPGTSINMKITENVDLLTGEMIYKEYIIGRD